jgi:CO/xanthine dehydrogenase FAD-binding subunit
LAGNIINASPAADLPPALLAADAELELKSHQTSRRVALRSFFAGYKQIDLRPGELLTAIRLRPLADGHYETFRKVGTRRAQAISKVVGACRLGLDESGKLATVRFAFGSIAATSLRLEQVEAHVFGKAPSEALASEAAALAKAAVNPIDDVRSSADYRRHVVGELIRSWMGTYVKFGKLGR